jgi:aquaporin Z
MNEKLRNYLCEFIGAFIITAFVCGILLFADAPDMYAAALPAALCLMAVTALFLPLSGAHFNPIISLAALIKGKLEAIDFFCYIAAQLAGAFAGFGFAALIEGDSNAMFGSEVGHLETYTAFAFEAVCAFVLVFIYLELTSRTKNSVVAPIFIGGAAAFVLTWSLNVTGSVINPFRSLAAAIFSGGIYISDLWIFMLAPFVGGALAALVQPRICE